MRLVQFTTEDGLRLNGLFCDGGSDTTVIHVHGKGGNFYENKFVKLMMAEYPAAGINFLSFNNRGFSTYAEAYGKGGVEYIGSAVETFEDCIFDLNAAVEFASEMSSRVILQGHSFGCEKSVFFATQKDPRIELILLSPCDAHRLQKDYIEPESVETQLERLLDQYGKDSETWLPESEYGIKAGEVQYHVPITAKALIALLQGPPFELFRLDRPWQKPPLSNPTLAYLGGTDSLQIDGIPAMERGLAQRISNLQMLIADGNDHHLRPDANATINEIIKWINR